MTNPEPQQKRTKRATLSDVAKAAGVSVGTASKALNDRFDVGEATRRKVQRIAAELSFRPNALARGLLEGRSHSVGIVTSDLTGRFAPAVMLGAEDALGADRSTVLLSITRGDPDLEAHHVRQLQERRVDGLIVVGDYPAPRPPIADAGGTPVVYAFAPSTDPGDYSVIPDNVAAARLAVEHLAGLGRSRVVYLGGPAEERAAQDRAKGTREGLVEAGLDVTALQFLYGSWSETWGWDAVGSLLDAGIAFDAVVGGDDQIARGAIDRLIDHGLRVPEDVAVVGFDNSQHDGNVGRRPITSLDMSLQEIGSLAAQALASERTAEGGVHVVAPTLVVRSSTVRPS